MLVASQIRDDGGDDVGGSSLGSRVAIRLHADRHQTENGNQTKGGDTESESQLDKGKGGCGSLFHRL